jgi:hypothetical protein
VCDRSQSKDIDESSIFILNLLYDSFHISLSIGLLLPSHCPHTALKRGGVWVKGAGTHRKGWETNESTIKE